MDGKSCINHLASLSTHHTIYNDHPFGAWKKNSARYWKMKFIKLYFMLQ